MPERERIEDQIRSLVAVGATPSQERSDSVSIPALVADAQHQVASQRPVPLPSLASRLAGHPGFLGYAMRDQDEYNDAIRHDAFVHRLRAIRDKYPDQFAASVAGHADDGSPILWGQVPIDHDTTPSPYKWRGVAAAGQPLREGSDWIRSVFSVPQNVLRVLGGSANQAKAEGDLAAGLDTALMGIPSIVAGRDPNPEWLSSKDRPFASLGRLLDGAAPAALMEARPTQNPRAGITAFSEALRDIGAPNSVATDIAGGAMDAVVDPFPLGAAAARSALARKFGRAALEAGAEFLPQVGLNYWMSPARQSGARRE